MHFDTIIIGAGLSGLSAGCLLSKRGQNIAVIEQSDSPGGSCGLFKRNNALFDQGSSMLSSFVPEGFHAHRFLFTCF